MDPETIFIECTALAVDICLFGLFYKLYKSKKECLKSLKEAECLDINTELKSSVKDRGGIVPYAVIAGNVKALNTPLRSQYFPHIRGVIREKITKERKVKWSPMLRIWSSMDHDIQHSVNSIPFALCGRNSGFFKKQVCVEIVDPLSAQELILPVTYDEFTTCHDTIGEAVFGFFRGERTIGIEEVENMLTEDTTVTAIGQLILENDKLKIKPPDKHGFTYFLTPLTLESLIKKINETARLYRIVATLMGAVSIFLFAYIAKRGFSELKERIVRARQLKRCEEARRLRRMADSSRRSQGESYPKCVVCLENPVEILILECGHACLCLNCSEQIRNICPVCRALVDRLVPAYLP